MLNRKKKQVDTTCVVLPFFFLFICLRKEIGILCRWNIMHKLLLFSCVISCSIHTETTDTVIMLSACTCIRRVQSIIFVFPSSHHLSFYIIMQSRYTYRCAIYVPRSDKKRNAWKIVIGYDIRGNENIFFFSY